MTYRAVVKYPVKATDTQKLAALREGLQEIVQEMVEEHPSVDRDYIDRAIEDAQGAAEDALEYREQYNAGVKVRVVPSFDDAHNFTGRAD